MSEYLRRTRSVNFGPLRALVDFGQEVECGRITVTVKAFTSEQRRAWKRAIERLGIITTEVDYAGAGKYTHTGKFKGERRPRTISYSCQGEQWALQELILLPIVENYNQSEARIPFYGAGTMPKKIIPKKERLGIVRQYEQGSVPVVI